MSQVAHTPFILDEVEFGPVKAFDTWLAVSENPENR